MRLHQLQIQAFGPFGGKASVDFDQLGDAGLFLLCGKTGAGKSSVLDAVCFGLYGVVPGARHSARQLRSDHADPGVAPEVTLEFSVSGRRFRSRRTPQWQRPKRRGTGITTQHASVVIEEAHDDAWHTLTTRLDEAGDLVTGLLGMQASQFTQVAMLPQGDFQRFLGAKSDDRQTILQRLFNTDRFARIEHWLRERRVEVSRRVRTSHSHLTDVLSRVQEVAGHGTPEAWEDTELGVLIRRGDVAAWTDEVVSTATAESTTAEKQAAQTADDLRRRTIARDEAASLDALQRRGDLARATLERAREAHSRTRELQDSLVSHQRAQPVLAVVRQRDEADARVAALTGRAHVLVESADLDEDISPESARAALASAEKSLLSLEEFLPRQQEWERAIGRVEELELQRASLDDEVPVLEARLRDFPQQRDALQSDLVAARLAAAEVRHRADDLDDARAALEAVERLSEVTAMCTGADDAVRAATTVHQDLRARHQDLREARINAMAGELAAGLAAGCSCPVCGSQSHPAPASAHDVVSEQAEAAAAAAVDDAALALEMRADEARTLHHEMDALAAITQGHDRDVWAERVRVATESHRDTVALASRAQQLQGSLDALDADEAAASASLRDVQQRRTRVLADLESLSREIGRFERDASRLLQDSSHDTVAEAIGALRPRVDRLRVVVEVLGQLASATAEAERVAQTAVREATDAGFADPDEARAADLGARADEIGDELERLQSAWSAARATLDEPAVHEAMQQDRPDLGARQDALALAEETHQSARAAAQLARLRSERLRTLGAQVADALSACTPLLEEYELVAGLADMAEGKSTDNPLRMRLSAYVLSERLRSVVAAANDQLGRMGLDRFTLEQADSGSSGDRRGGLGLRIRDSWTSTVRETGTLSGGEGFMVSLALALGLAETVTSESGGTRIETLFVDEGFGSLDSEALEGVLDTLDSLRSGGRAVGVVSHVSEMRERISTQLRVSAHPHGGSTLTVISRE